MVPGDDGVAFWVVILFRRWARLIKLVREWQAPRVLLSSSDSSLCPPLFFPLGDLWSFDYYRGEFIVSPTPDIWVHKIDRQADKFIVIASDGLWGVIKPDESVHLVQAFDKNKDYMGGEVSKR